MAPLNEEELKKMERRQSLHSQSPGRDGDVLAITMLAGPAGLRLTGEVDANSHDQLRRALAALPADANPAIHLELAELRFIDVAGTRELMALTQSHPGLCLILHHPPQSLQRLIGLLWPGANAQIHANGTRDRQQGTCGPITLTTARPPKDDLRLA
jgi:STAS domain